jgi:hypothetical protein
MYHKMGRMEQMPEALNEKHPLEGWTTIQHASKLIGRQPSLIRYWIKRGYISAYEIAPRVTVVNLDEVRAYHAEHKPHNIQPTT